MEYDSNPSDITMNTPPGLGASAKKRNKKKQLRNERGKTYSVPQLFRTSLLYQTKEFFDNSTLHGIRYIAEKGRPFGEK